MMNKLLLLTCFLFALNIVSAKQINVVDFGAVADTAVLSTKAIQAAISECSKSGGTVIFPAGNYKTGTLYFKSNVTLHLEKGVTIYGSKNLADYPENLPDFTFFRKGVVKSALIYAEKCSNITIEGDGKIDGQGASFWVPEGSKVNSYSVRPYLIWMIQCSDIRIEGIKLGNSAFWMQHYLGCDNLYVHNIEVFNHSNKNNDMIDIDGCHNVRISDCLGDSDDDSITMKSTSGRANENVVITNCIISSHCNAIKMGTESNTGFKNIVISNIRIEGSACPIFIRRGNRARAYYEGQKIERPGELMNVSISNVIATGADKTGCSITGIPGYPVENISLSNISIEFDGGGQKENINREIPEKEKAYPEFDMFGELPSYGFFIRHANNIRFSDVVLKTKSEDARPASYLSDVHSAAFKNTTFENPGLSNCNIQVENCGDIQINGSSVIGKSISFVTLKGDNNNSITIANNMFRGIEKIFSPENATEKIIRETGNLK